jgi:glycosyltransferase involved in cell wall biosynthesis
MEDCYHEILGVHNLLLGLGLEGSRVNRFKLFLLLPYQALGWRAELELVKRFQLVAQRLGFDCFASSSIRDAREMGADCVLALHYESPKAGPECFVGLVWNPLSFMRGSGTHAFVKTLSCDAHFYAAESLRRYFSGLSRQGYRTHDLGDFWPSAPASRYDPVERFGPPTYIGALWQKNRHHDLFSLLEAGQDMRGYGPSIGWSRFSKIYGGAFPLDGHSYHEIYRRTGVGLCLHSREHLTEGIPGMRIFEATSASCVAICDRHPFIQKHFGDTVYYLDTQIETPGTAEQLRAIMAEIQRSPAQAREKAKAAHQIFLERFSLDLTLREAVDKIALFKNKRHVPSRRLPAARIEVIIRTKGTRRHLLRRALQSVADQTLSHVNVLIVHHGSNPDEFFSLEMTELQKLYPRLCLRSISLPESQALSRTITFAVEHSSAEFISFLDDDDWYHPEHLATLLQALSGQTAAVVAMSGAAVDWEWDLGGDRLVPSSSFTRDNSGLLSFEPFEPERFNRGETNLCIAMLMFRRTALADNMASWADLDIAEDRALLSRLCGGDASRCVFTSRVSCTWSYRQLQADNQLDIVQAKPSLGFAYHGVRLPYLESAKQDRTRYHSHLLFRQCCAARKLVYRLRWLPRSLRVILYQRKLNLLMTHILQQLAGLGVIESYHQEEVNELARLAEVSLPYGRQQRKINLVLTNILSARLSVEDSGLPQHIFNRLLVREVDFLCRSF